MKKILIIRLGAIGDVVHTTNLYRAIKKYDKNIEIHYLTSEITAPLLESDKDISKVICIKNRFTFFQMLKIAKKLKEEKYDCAINLQPSMKLRLLVLFSKIKRQLIYKKDFRVHAVTNFWQTGLKAFKNLEEIKELKLYLPDTAINKAKERVKNLKRPIIVINAGGMFSKRQGRAYPIEKWVQLENRIAKEMEGTIILNGAKEDREYLQKLGDIENCVNYIGELSLIDSCGLISQADLMISGDSGPLHIASALGIKSIGLYGSMPVNRTGCYCNGINIVSKMKCVPCNRRKCKYLKKTNKIYAPCMEDIDIDTIMKSVKELIK